MINKLNQGVMKRKINIKHKINGESFFVNETIYTCPFCNNEVLPDDFDPLEKIYREYLKQYDLNFDDFKNIRKNIIYLKKCFQRSWDGVKKQS